MFLHIWDAPLNKKLESFQSSFLQFELDDQTSETISGGGAEGELAWSIRFGDVTRTPRNSSSQIPPRILIW